MKNRKGFTLIELLAVIVILAVIAVIAVPKILNMIEDAKKASVKNSAYGYVESIENKVAHQALLGNEYEDKDDYAYEDIKVDMKGTKPTYVRYSLKKGIVESGVFCIDNYIVNYTNKKVTVGNECNEDELKLPGNVEISVSSGNYTYPISGTFKVTTNISGGTLSCTTSDKEVATCSISGDEVTVTPGTKEGQADITVISAATSKHKEAQAVHVAITAKGTLQSITANGYKGEYDGEEHGITVTAPNAIIKYGEEKGICDLTTSPKYSEVGMYTVYYEIESAGYTTVTGSRQVIITQAEGLIELEATSGQVEYSKTKEVKIKENKSNGEVKVTSSNIEIAEAVIENGKLKINGKKTGKTTIIVRSGETHNYKEAETKYEVEVIKANNKLEIKPTTGNYTYPTSGTFEIIENLSGGTLTCETSNSSVATCSIEGNKVTVKPGKKEGQASITIKSEETANYNGTQAVHVANTAKGTLNSYTVIGYTGIYDGKSHGITVTSSGSTIKYGEEEGTYDKIESPTYKDVGTYKVYYQIETEGYGTVRGSEIVEITKAEGSVTAPTAKSLIYTGSAQELIKAGASTTGEIQYKLKDGVWNTSIPKATNPGTYTVYYKVVGDKNHENVAEKSITVTIEKATISYTKAGYTGIYDGESHGITVKSEGATIKYGTTSGTYDKTENPTYSDVGTYTVYYQITREGYVTVTGSETVEITKANNKLTLSANSANYTYPESGTFEIKENISGGTLTCETNDSSIATCSISGTTVTVTPGKTEGNATITIKSAATKNYNGTQAAHEAITAKGTIPSVTATGYTVTYDGSAHGITVSTTLAGATIKYGESNGTYDKDASPTYKNAGTYTVYYQITKEGYNTITGSKDVVINKANGNVTAPTAKTLLATGSAQTLINAGSSSTGTIEYKLGSSGTWSTNLPSATNAGTYTVYYRVLESTNYQAVSERSITITIVNASCSITMNTTGWATSKTATITGTGLGTGITLQYQVKSGNNLKTDWTTIGSGATKTIDWTSTTEMPTYVYCRIITESSSVSNLYTETKIDREPPITPNVIYNGGSNSCSWKNNYNITLNSTDNVNVAYYEIDHHGDGTVDETTGANFIPPNGWSTCTAIFRAVDHVGNRSEWTERQHIHMDTHPPAAPSVPDLIPEHDTGSSNTDNITMWWYDMQIQGTAEPGMTIHLRIANISNDIVGIATADANGYWTVRINLHQNTWNHIYAWSVDAAGNYTQQSNYLAVYSDTTAPTVPGITYNGGSNSCSWKNNYNLNLSSNDATGIWKYQTNHNMDGSVHREIGSNFVPESGYSTCSDRYRAVDHAGNVGGWTEPQHIHMDTIAPTCTSSGGSDAWTNSAGRTLVGTCSDTGGSGCKGNVTWLINWEGSWTNLSPGTVYDNAGNSVVCPANQTVKVDTTAPTCTSSGGSDAWINSAGRTLVGTCSDTGGSGCKGNVTWLINWQGNWTNLSPGTVYDNAGNSVVCPANQTVRVDTTAPTCKHFNNMTIDGTAYICGKDNESGFWGVYSGYTKDKYSSINVNSNVNWAGWGYKIINGEGNLTFIDKSTNSSLANYDYCIVWKNATVGTVTYRIYDVANNMCETSFTS